MHHNSSHKKGQFILLIVCAFVNGLDFLLFIIGFISLLGLDRAPEGGLVPLRVGGRIGPII